MIKPFKFPQFSEMYPNISSWTWDKQIRTYLRYQFSVIKNQKECQQFVEFINQHPLWQPIFEQNIYRADALLSTYCDQRFSAKARLVAIINNFEIAAHKLSPEKWAQLIEQKSIVLAKLTETLTLNLNINDIDPFEGFFSINIQDMEKRRYYDASFSFIAPNSLLISSIQGPKGADAQENVKQITKQLYGVRPMYMLVNSFKILADQFNCQLLGIAHKNQAKYRWNDSRRLLFNYDEFWKENQAQQNSKGYWVMDTHIEQKPLEEIQSKKRSMYRKRYEMFATMQQDIHQYIFAQN